MSLAKYGKNVEFIKRIIVTNIEILNKLKTLLNELITSIIMDSMNGVISQNNLLKCDDLATYIRELNHNAGMSIKDFINAANEQRLKKYCENLKTMAQVYEVFGSNPTCDKGLCGKILEFALFGNMPNSDSDPDLGDNGDIKTNKWEKLKKSGGYRATERIKIGSAGNTDNWSSFDPILNSSNITQLNKWRKMSCGIIPLIERGKNSCGTLECILNLRILYVAIYDLGKSNYVDALNEDLENIKGKLRNRNASQKGQKYLHLHTQGAGKGKNAGRALGYTPKFVTTLVAESIARDKKISIDSVLIAKGRSLYINPDILK
jgi:hypothetical protein